MPLLPPVVAFDAPGDVNDLAGRAACNPTVPTVPTAIDGVRLRPWRDGDQAALVAIANDRRVWRNMTDRFPHPYTAADADQWIAFNAEPGRDRHLAIEVGGALAGGIGAIAGEGLRVSTADFGYWLGQGFWGRGIASACARALADELLGSGAFERLEAAVFAWNPASMRVLEHAGFEREGVLRRSVRKDGELIDSVLCARLHPAAASAAAAYSGLANRAPRS